MRKRPTKIAKSNKGFGLNELIGIAAALILAAFIVIPGLITFGKNVMGKLDSWWETISDDIFCEQVVETGD